MPTVNVFYKEKSQKEDLKKLAKELKSYIAAKLTCRDIKLSSNEVSVRLLSVEGANMIGAVELEIKAHVFEERVKKQDEICNEVRNYIEKKYPSLGEVRVWLVLSELGHSWE